MVVFYGLIFFIPKAVQFSYAGDTCIGQLTLFPALQRASSEDNFAVSFRDETKVGSLVLASSKICFEAVSEPKKGNAAVSASPFGGILARKDFRIATPETPQAHTETFTKPLPVSKPLEVQLSEPDDTFDYQLRSDETTADCEKSDEGVRCDVPALNLEQGKKYSLKLTRKFKQSSPVTLVEKSVETLRAVSIKKASLKDGQVVYTKPLTFDFVTDKPLANARAVLKTHNKKPQQISVTTEVKDKTLTVKLPKQLARETNYRLTLESAEAIDGSTFVDPRTIDFTMSGGPKVRGVNIGTSRVDRSGVITISFDQKMQPTDIKKYVSVEGGNAIISQQSTTVTIALQSLPRCKAFTIKIEPGISSRYKIVSKKAWQFSSRTRCSSVETIGYSHKGRAIQAYTFGSGSKSILFTGAIHGNEKSSYSTMQGWIQNLESRAPSLPKGKQVVVVPMVNPDGYYVYGRKNARDVNLNRNFPTSNWEKDIKISSSQTDKGGGGRSPGSEYETKALMSLTNRVNPYMVITYHSSGSLINSNTVSPAAAKGSSYARSVGYGFVSDADTAETFGFTMTGTYEDWLAETGRAAFLVELPTDNGNYASAHYSAMWSMI